MFFGKPEDALANNLFKRNAQKKSPLPGMLAGVQQNPDSKPMKANSLWEGAKFMASKAWQHRELLATAAARFAPMLLGDADDDDTEDN